MTTTLKTSNLGDFNTEELALNPLERLNPFKSEYGYTMPKIGYRTGIETTEKSINRSYPNITLIVDVLRAKNAIVVKLTNKSKSSFTMRDEQPKQGEYSTSIKNYEWVIFKVDESKPFHVRLGLKTLDGTEEVVFKG